MVGCTDPDRHQLIKSARVRHHNSENLSTTLVRVPTFSKIQKKVDDTAKEWPAQFFGCYVGGGDITMPPRMFQDHSARHGADKQTCSNMCSSILVTFSFPDRILRLTRDRPAGGGGSLQFPQRMSSFKLFALTKAPCLLHPWQFYISWAYVSVRRSFPEAETSLIVCLGPLL
jgi:hypothetical protein